MKIYTKLFSFVLLLFALAAVTAPRVPEALAVDYAWRVVAVADGDTITVEPVDGGERVKVRLYGIDCPEKGQPHGQAARSAVVKAALFKMADIEVKDRDRYGRTVALVTIESPGRINGETVLLQELLLESGLAWVYVKYCRDKGSCRAWQELEARARDKRLGLWRDDEPIPPWQWRKR